MIRGKEDLDIAENMFSDWPQIAGVVQQVVYDRGKYRGFCLSYVAGDYLVQHEAGLGKRLGKVEGVVVLKTPRASVLVDSIAVCFPTHVLRYWSSAFLIDPYHIKQNVNEESSYLEVLLSEMNNVKDKFVKSPEETVSLLRYRGKILGSMSGRSVVVSGGLPSLGKRR